ncbi:phosphatidate cytidylyltransferase [Flavitalea flava]
MRNFTYIFLLLLIATVLDSCAVVGGIFKAGVWVGVLIVVAIIALVILLISKASGKK